ncbi:MAG: aminotransferase class I/II-fold pyridoxal phosphate-dependent enzyme, partial [Planctomycetaceae bacterium]
LAHDARIIAAARTALEHCGSGATASALVAGRTIWHERLERRLAEFERQEAAILFPTGYAANAGTVSALIGPEDVIFCDRLNHAGLIDGCRLSGAKLRIYRHDRLERLERELQKPNAARRRWIITDAVFSMDAELAPLRELCDLAERFGAEVLVDEAHGTGVFGRGGRGVAEELGVEDRIAVRVGTLSKAAASLGGFVAGPQPLIDTLWNSARPQMFSTALPPSACAAAVAALDIIEQEPERRARLRSLSAHLRRRLRNEDYDVPGADDAPIVPVVLGEPDAAVAAAGRLEQAGLLVAAIRPPTVPHGTSRLRITVSASHSQRDVEDLARANSCRR